MVDSFFGKGNIAMNEANVGEETKKRQINKYDNLP